MASKRKSDTIVDIRLISGVDNSCVIVNSFKLAEVSEYFEHAVRSMQSDRSITIDVSLPAAKIIAKYAERGIIDMDIQSVESVLAVANQFNIIPMKERCAEFMRKQLNTITCVRFYELANKYDLEFAFPLSLRYFMVLNENEAFNRCHVNNLERIFADDDLVIESEENVFEVLLSWSRSHMESEELQNAVRRLLMVIRLPLLDTGYFRDYVWPICMKWSCVDLADEYFDSRLLQETTSLRKLCYRQRSRHGDVLCAVGFDSRNHNCIIEPLGAHGNYAQHQFNVLDKRYLSSLIKTERGLYIIGGFQHSLTCAQTTDIKLFKKCISTLQVDLYRFDKRKRESVQPMIEARVYNGVGYIENCIYVAGGNNRDKYLNSVERLDINGNHSKWKSVQSMNHERSCVASAVYNGCLYIFGGRTRDQVLDSVECYDPRTNMWTELRKMKEPRHGAVACAHDNFLYVMGGCKALNNNKPAVGRAGVHETASVERYDPNENVWESVAPLHIKRDHFGILANNHYIYAVGGYGPETKEYQYVERYDARKNRWTRMLDLKKVGGFCSVVSLNKTYSDRNTSGSEHVSDGI